MKLLYPILVDENLDFPKDIIIYINKTLYLFKHLQYHNCTVKIVLKPEDEQWYPVLYEKLPKLLINSGFSLYNELDWKDISPPIIERDEDFQ